MRLGIGNKRNLWITDFQFMLATALSKLNSAVFDHGDRAISIGIYHFTGLNPSTLGTLDSFTL